MTKEKDLLLKYLCMALPYDCILSIADGGIDGLQWVNVTLNSYLLYQIEEEDGLEYIKPYLRLMLSMTEEEEYEFRSFADTLFRYGEDNIWCCLPLDAIQWLLEKHFDFMGLIPKNLAIEVTENNNPYEMS